MRESVQSGHPYDLVLIDYQMPVLDGPEAVAQMRESGFIGRIVGVTGYSDDLHINSFLSRGANKVLLKPVSLSAIARLMQRDYLNSHSNIG